MSDCYQDRVSVDVNELQEMTDDALAIREENTDLRQLLYRVVNELRDPIGKEWCDYPVEDRALLAALVRDICEKMGLENE